MDSKLRRNSLKQWFFNYCILIAFFPMQVSGAPGNSSGICNGGLIGVTTINVYANSNASEESGIIGGFTFTRTSDLSKQISASFILSGTAQNGIDYNLITSTIQFAAGESEKSISIIPVDDTDLEGTENITLTLSLGTGYIVGNHISDTINLTDNDNQSANSQTKQPQDTITEDQQLNTSIARKLSISSATQADLHLGKLVAGSAFKITNETCSNSTIKAGSYCDVDIVFSPKNSAQQLGILIIPTRDPAAQSIVKLNGQGDVISVSSGLISINSTPLSINFTGGGATCKIDTLQWLDSAQSLIVPAPPGGAEFIPGFDMVEYKTIACEPGATINVTIDYQGLIPADAKLMQFGATPDNASDHWYEIKTAELSGIQASYTVSDGQEGDQDLAGNGSVNGLIGLLVPRRVQVAAPGLPAPVSNVSQIRPIPTVNPIGLLLMAISIVGLAKRSLFSTK